jgi:hypothetical protein
MFALLAYAFITLFTGIVLFGHFLLFRDIFSGGRAVSDPATRMPAQPKQAAERCGSMQQQEAA